MAGELIAGAPVLLHGGDILDRCRRCRDVVDDQADLARVEDVAPAEWSLVAVLQIVARDVLDHVAGRIEKEDRVRVPVAVVDDLWRIPGGAVPLGNGQQGRARLLPLERRQNLVLRDVEGEVIERGPGLSASAALTKVILCLAGFDGEAIALLVHDAQVEGLAIERLHRAHRRRPAWSSSARMRGRGGARRRAAGMLPSRYVVHGEECRGRTRRSR